MPKLKVVRRKKRVNRAASASEDISELEVLMGAARRRVLHALIFLLVVLVAVASQFSWIDALQPKRILSVVYWSLGYIAILTLLVIWYRARVAATKQLMDLVQSGAFRLHRIDTTHLHIWHVISIGFEVDVITVSGEHLAFGFWTEYDAAGLKEVLTQIAVPDVDDADED